MRNGEMLVNEVVLSPERWAECEVMLSCLILKAS